MMNYKLNDNRGIRRFGVNIGYFMLAAVLIMTSAMFDVSIMKASGSGNYPPPSEGDWIIASNTQVSNETITLHGNLIIQNGGSLTLNNVKLFMDQTGTQTLRIEIMAGGSMQVLDNDNDSTTTADASVITTSTYYGYLFIADQGSQLELRNSQVSGCGQYSTAGLYTWGIYIATDNAVIENNAIGQTYSGIVIDGGTHNRVVSNTINSSFCGVYLYNAVDNMVSENSVSTSGGIGYGIYLYESQNNIITYNIADSHQESGVRLTCSNYNIIGNNTTNSNAIAGIELISSSYNFVSENTAKFNTYYAGGGIVLENASFGNTISGNNLESNSHGIHIATDYYISTDYNNVFIWNQLHDNTIGIYIWGSNRNLVTDNTAWENTVGIFSGASSHVEIDNTIEKNIVAYNDEDGIRVFQSNSVIIDENFAYNNGVNGINLDHTDNCTISRCAVFYNVESGIKIYGDEWWGDNNTIVNTIVDYNAIGILVDGCSATVLNNTIIRSIYYGVACINSPPTHVINSIVQNPGDDLYGCSSSYSNIGDCDFGVGNICADPMFVNVSAGDLHLMAGSPCIDTGTDTGAPTEDYEGTPRPLDGDGNGIAKTDMGAYEYSPTPILTPTPTPTPSTIVTGITREVNGEILPGVSITIDGAGTVVSDQNGLFQITGTSTGSKTVVAHKDGFKDETQMINVEGLGESFTVTCNFQGQYGLIPNAPDMWYALDCVNLWLYPPNGDIGLDMWTALDAVNAWLYPVR